MIFVIFAEAMKHNLLLLPLLLLAALPAKAQEKQPSWLVRTATNLFKSLTSPKKYLDSTYVLQPTLKWTVAAEGEVIHTGADLHSNLTVTDLIQEDGDILYGRMDTGIEDRPCWKVGLAAAYGSLRLGYGLQLNKKEGEHNRYFSFGFSLGSFGFRSRYVRVFQNPTGVFALGDSDPIYLSSNHPGEMRNLSLYGYYAFNRRRFVYSATQDGRTLQRRSAGSWMVSAKFLRGSFFLNPEDSMWSILSDLRGYTTQQFSLGGGYSFNWVLFHRDPADPVSMAGLRNFTINVTALPMISFLNGIQTEQGQGDELTKIRHRGQPALAPYVSGALCYTLGRCSICANVSYDRFGFQGVKTTVSSADELMRTDVRTEGVFHDLTLQAKVNVRF